MKCCGGNCIDTAADPLHCGACDLACTPAPQVLLACEGGLCITSVCSPGYADCNAMLADGCEANLQTA